MPRVGPNYTLPQPPFVPQTPIASAAMNSDLSDIADALTGSLARNGAGGMTAVLPLANDGFVFQNDPDTGISRSAANTMSFECGNSEVMEVSPTGVNVTGDLKQNGLPILPVGLGPLPWSGLTAPSGWILCNGQTLLRSAYPKLWEFAQLEINAGNTLYGSGDGSTTFTVPNVSGRVIAGREASSTLLTPTYFGGNSTVPGATGGSESTTLTLAQLPTGITASGSNSISASTSNGVGIMTYGAGGFVGTLGGGGTSGGFANPATMGLASATVSGINSISVTSNNTSGNPHRTVQPTIITNYIIFAGV